MKGMVRMPPSSCPTTASLGKPAEPGFLPRDPSLGKRIKFLPIPKHPKPIQELRFQREEEEGGLNVEPGPRLSTTPFTTTIGCSGDSEAP